ncbi:MAG: molybdenum cofactor biosynthesis protein MoaE [Actinomycetota bacterium]
MSNQIVRTTITELPIDIGDLISSVESPHCGAVVTFAGNVRSEDSGKKVLSLKYEIHPTTEAKLQSVVEEICGKFDILFASVAHRYGEIPIGETALAVAVSSPHRQAALEACSLLVDEIKAHIPIWKFQSFVDGTSEWVNSA